MNNIHFVIFPTIISGREGRQLARFQCCFTNKKWKQSWTWSEAAAVMFEVQKEKGENSQVRRRQGRINIGGYCFLLLPIFSSFIEKRTAMEDVSENIGRRNGIRFVIRGTMRFRQLRIGTQLSQPALAKLHWYCVVVTLQLSLHRWLSYCSTDCLKTLEIIPKIRLILQFHWLSITSSLFWLVNQYEPQ